jgi:hypothetical protein
MEKVLVGDRDQMGKTGQEKMSHRMKKKSCEQNEKEEEVWEDRFRSGSDDRQLT